MNRVKRFFDLKSLNITLFVIDFSVVIFCIFEKMPVNELFADQE